MRVCSSAIAAVNFYSDLACAFKGGKLNHSIRENQNEEIKFNTSRDKKLLKSVGNFKIIVS